MTIRHVGVIKVRRVISAAPSVLHQYFGGRETVVDFLGRWHGSISVLARAYVCVCMYVCVCACARDRPGGLAGAAEPQQVVVTRGLYLAARSCGRLL